MRREGRRNGRRGEEGTGEYTASQSLQAIHLSSPDGYRRNACSPLKRGDMGP